MMPREHRAIAILAALAAIGLGAAIAMGFVLGGL